jgi:hypothetical protein
MRPILERESCNYVEYDTADNANILHENFYLVKKLFGIVIYRKRFRQNSNIWNNGKRGLGYRK